MSRFMDDEDYDALAKNLFGELYEINRNEIHKFDEIFDNFLEDVKEKIFTTSRQSGIDLAAHALAYVYKHARLWVNMSCDDELVFLLTLDDKSPKISFSFSDVFDAFYNIGKFPHKKSIENIDKAISELNKIRALLKSGKTE